MKKIFSTILITLGCSGLFLACGSEFEPTPTPPPPLGSGGNSGAGGQGGSTMESSGNGSVSFPACLEGQIEDCPKYCSAQACQRCQGFGCTLESKLCDDGIEFYSDMISCLQDSKVQENCAACKDIVMGDPILSDCSSCAVNHSNCILDCNQL